MGSFGPSLSQLGADLGDSSITGTANQDEDTSDLSLAQLGVSTPLLPSISLQPTSTFSFSNQLVDPTNTGDTGAKNNTSTPFLPSINNPETAGASTLGSVLSAALNTGFAAWQISSQPANTPKTVTTKVGATTVTSGAAPSILSSLLGGTSGTPAAAAQSQILLLIVLAIVGFLVYRAVK